MNKNEKEPKLYNETDEEAVDLARKIHEIFEVACRDSYSELIDKEEYKKLYSYLEKGYSLSEFQIKRIENGHLFAMKIQEEELKTIENSLSTIERDLSDFDSNGK